MSVVQQDKNDQCELEVVPQPVARVAQNDEVHELRLQEPRNWPSVSSLVDGQVGKTEKRLDSEPETWERLATPRGDLKALHGLGDDGRNEFWRRLKTMLQ